jgi:hypothetical protein
VVVILKFCEDSSPTGILAEEMGSRRSLWVFGTATCMFTFSKVEPIESLRKMAWMDIFPDPVRVGWKDMVKSFFEYATTQATISIIQEETYGMIVLLIVVVEE